MSRLVHGYYLLGISRIDFYHRTNVTYSDVRVLGDELGLPAAKGRIRTNMHDMYIVTWDCAAHEEAKVRDIAMRLHAHMLLLLV